MSKKIVPLSETQIRKAKPQNKQYKLFDGGGLFMLITPSGGKLWRLKYRFLNKEKLLTFGVYPEVSLAGAREKRFQAKKKLSEEIDPGEEKKTDRALAVESGTSFEVVAREWHNKFTPTWSSSHAHTIIRRLERDVFPWLGSHDIADIRAPELLAVFRRVESRGAQETAHRIKVICGQVFRYAIATGCADRDVTADLKGALPPAKKSHLAAITDPKKVCELLRAMDGYEGSFVVKCALRLAPLVFVRPGELRQAEWSEIDFEKAEWNIPADRMKVKQAHLVPLSSQALEIIQAGVFT